MRCGLYSVCRSNVFDNHSTKDGRVNGSILYDSHAIVEVVQCYLKHDCNKRKLYIMNPGKSQELKQ